MEEFKTVRNSKDAQSLINNIQRKMLEAAEKRDFESAAKYRDKMKRLQQFELYLNQSD